MQMTIMNTYARVLVQGITGLALTIAFVSTSSAQTAPKRASAWSVGTPIVTYWAGPSMTDATAIQMKEGGWNLVWCTEKELDTAKRHGLRAQLQDPLISPANLDDPAQRPKLDALIDRVRTHPALYSYFITDEPCATNFASLGKLVRYLGERDPAHLAYINLFPTYANNEQLGTKGDVVTAYNEHLRQFVDIVKPGLISYDHYQFSTNGDNPDYFLNLGLVRNAAQSAGLPFLNIVQACTWTPSMRVPNGNEMRYLVYTTLAYGAQGISYYVYSWPGHTGMIADSNGTPTVLYHALKPLNREFVAIATQLKPYHSMGIYHAGMLPPGAAPLPKDAAFKLDPPISALDFKAQQPAKGIMLGYFGKTDKSTSSLSPSHVVVVNLDYTSDAVVGLTGPGWLQSFDATKDQWSQTVQPCVGLRLPPGGGKLLRVKPE